MSSLVILLEVLAVLAIHATSSEWDFCMVAFLMQEHLCGGRMVEKFIFLHLKSVLGL